MKYTVSRSRSVSPEEILIVRQSTGSGPESQDLWQKIIAQSLCVVAAREEISDELIGIGFLAGNQRHAQLVDISVVPAAQKQGIAGQIVDELVSFAREQNIRYVGLTYNTKSPWLKDFYTNHGFRPIDFAMWLKDSLDSSDI